SAFKKRLCRNSDYSQKLKLQLFALKWFLNTQKTGVGSVVSAVVNIHPFHENDLNGKALFFIAGPCVIESEQMCMTVADRLARLAIKTGATVIFKASYDKANRTSQNSFRGLGIEEGLRILEKVRTEFNLPLITDVHEVCDVAACSQVVDLIQIPAFLCRQTDLLVAAARSGKYVNIKKGQFMAPWDMRYAVEKAGSKALVTERGTSFGYNRLVVDFTGLHALKGLSVPVVFDATHSVQFPGGGHQVSSGNREWAVPLAAAAICHKVNGLFFEVHPNPEVALSDGANSLCIDEFEENMPRLCQLHHQYHALFPSEKT
ncbi:MAG: 3-deoxy-8-phosphooctulonate synthase, partial [Chitinivibrionales bacterium]|nr:3-deoxy-8-phosphooctulonate synthase [Chitinivibrionales bacterium]